MNWQSTKTKFWYPAKIPGPVFITITAYEGIIYGIENYAWNRPKQGYLMSYDEQCSYVMVKKKGSDVTCDMELRGKGLSA